MTNPTNPPQYLIDLARNLGLLPTSRPDATPGEVLHSVRELSQEYVSIDAQDALWSAYRWAWSPEALERETVG